MKVMKHELAKAIEKVKSIVQKNDHFPALSCVLVSDGYLTASSTELTLKVKLEGSEGTRLLIPMRTFDLIRNLPEGEMEITADRSNIVTIRMEKIRNSYQSCSPDDFPFDKPIPGYEGAVKLPGQQLMWLLSSVLYAASDKGVELMSSIYLHSTEEGLNAAAMDGHVMAWNWIADSAGTDISLLIPKSTVKKIVSMGILDDVYVTCDNSSAVFMTDEYVLYTRLIDGKYYNYRKIFGSAPDTSGTLIVNRKQMLAAMTRAKSCIVENKPVIFTVNGSVIDMEISDAGAHYSESIALENIYPGTLRIGFDSRLVLETIKAFTDDILEMNLTGAKAPMIVSGKSRLKALVLPVAIRG